MMNGHATHPHTQYPVLDFRSLSNNASFEERKEALNLLDNAYRTYGFIYLSNHGIPQTLVNESFEMTKRFFAFPHATKSLVRRSTNPFEPRGYTTVGDAVVNQEQQPRDLTELANARSTAPVEQRETFELGNPYTPDMDPNLLLPEDTLPGFKKWLEEWWDACMSLQLSLMGCFDEILSGTNTKAGALVKQQTASKSRSNMSLIHYHAMPQCDIRAGRARRCNAHTDSGQLTLLFQDGVGGLEVCDRSNQNRQAPFVPVPPIPGTVIVQLGDMLEKQSNGRWRSALHRVTAPPPPVLKPGQHVSEDDEKHVLQDRYSIAFFVYPDFETKIETLPGCKEKGPWNSLSWGAVQTAGEWWRKRIQLEFGGYGQKVGKVN